MTQKNIQTYISDVKFSAEHDPVVIRNYKSREKLENRKTHVFLEKFITQKSALIKTPNLAEVYFNTRTLRSHSYRFTHLGKQTIYSCL